MSQPRSRIIDVSTRRPGSFRSQLAVQGVLILGSLGVIGGLVWSALREVPVPDGCPSREEAFAVMQRDVLAIVPNPLRQQPPYREGVVKVEEHPEGLCAYSMDGQVSFTWEGARERTAFQGYATWNPGTGVWQASSNIPTED